MNSHNLLDSIPHRSHMMHIYRSFCWLDGPSLIFQMPHFPFLWIPCHKMLKRGQNEKEKHCQRITYLQLCTMSKKRNLLHAIIIIPRASLDSENRQWVKWFILRLLSWHIEHIMSGIKCGSHCYNELHDSHCCMNELRYHHNRKWYSTLEHWLDRHTEWDCGSVSGDNLKLNQYSILKQRT